MDLLELTNLCCRHNIRLTIEPGDGLYDCRFRMSKDDTYLVRILSGFELKSSRCSESQMLRDAILKMLEQLGVNIDE